MKWRQPLERGRSGYCWQTPTAPEARGILAGGGAKRSRRKRHDSNTRPERAPDRDWSCWEFWSGVPAGTRTIFFDLSRWLRFAPPPANFRRPSGAGINFAEFASGIARDRFGSRLRVLQTNRASDAVGFLLTIARVSKWTTKAASSQ